MSEWTVVTLKEFIHQRFADNDKALQAALVSQEKAVAAALAAAKEAVIKAERAADKRFDAVNEFRKTLSDQTTTFLPRAEYNAQHKALEDRVTDLTDRLNKSDGKTEGSDITMAKMVTLVGVMGTVLGIIVLLANKVF